MSFNETSNKSGRQILALNEKARTQSTSGPPVQKMVTVAVLPPRLPANMAPAHGMGTAGVFDYDEPLNWQHNEALPKDGEVRRMSFWEKAGLTTWRQPRNPDVPPYVMRQVPYDTWKKHYAKDKDGNYRGTHAPAEDCLLKPDDVQKWSGAEPETYGDKWTRGKEALPGYGEVKDEGSVPGYVDATDPAQAQGDSNSQGVFAERTVSSDVNLPASASAPNQGSGRTIDGKTTAQYIAEHEAKLAAAKEKEKEGKKKGGRWKDKFAGRRSSTLQPES